MKFVCIALLGLLLVGYGSAQTRQELCEAGELEWGYFVHDRYCNAFFTCSLDHWREYTCYGESAFNPATMECDYYENVNCGNLVMPSKQEAIEMSKKNPSFF